MLVAACWHIGPDTFLTDEVQEPMKTQHMDVTINRTRVAVPSEIETWGDLLEWIETNYLKAGQCITHVYFRGNETFDYRNSAISARDLASIGKIAVECGDFDTVVRESLEELEEELQSALDSSNEIIRLVEEGQEDEATPQLAQLLAALRICFGVLTEDAGWSEIPDAYSSREEFSDALEHAMVQLMSAHESEMWGSICDVLEYEVTPILESWQQVIERIRGQVA